MGQSETTINDIIIELEKIVFEAQGKITEKKIENAIAEKLRDSFGTRKIHQQYHIAGFWGLKIDIDFNDGEFGIEVKLLEELLKNATTAQRLMGQLLYYNRRQYGEDLILVVAGDPKLEEDAALCEIQKMSEEIGRFVFLPIYNPET
ncbi:hypothetical protein AAOE16_14830 [Ekhidna sp. MALMAid0563]|uniref:hypothetical protein n=1 Tax=Ekhidna sp. MALMAid0563 TaxID=3143937 RepID=UPI0032E027D5